jgi:hypothetical protein
VGNDGNLYGIAGSVVFQLMLSGGQWHETVLHTFTPDVDGMEPAHLVQDGGGNLIGSVLFPEQTLLGEIPGLFVLEKASGWVLSETSVGHCTDFLLNLSGSVNNLTIDAAGNVYGTGFDDAHASALGAYLKPGPIECYASYIFKASHDSGGWHYQDLDLLGASLFDAVGSLARDSSGNLYGTTYDCGANSNGTVWKLSP